MLSFVHGRIPAKRVTITQDTQNTVIFLMAGNKLTGLKARQFGKNPKLQTSYHILLKCMKNLENTAAMEWVCSR
jgi:hypothetical protein